MTNMLSGRSHIIALHPVMATPRQGGLILSLDLLRKVIHFALMTTVISAKATIVDEQFLDDVAVIESNMDSSAVGDKGKALGAYQFHLAAWTQANALAGTNHPHKSAHNWFVARRLAKVYLLWLEECIRDAGYKPTKINLYMAYNMGLSGSLRYAFDHQHPELPRSRRAILDRATRLIK